MFGYSCAVLQRMRLEAGPLRRLFPWVVSYKSMLSKHLTWTGPVASYNFPWWAGLTQGRQAGGKTTVHGHAIQ